MQTRSSTGTPLKPPSRYIQPKAQPKAKVKPRAKASVNSTSMPKEKARAKGRGTRVQSRKLKAEIHQPKDHDHEVLSSSPYGVLTGVGLNHLNVAPGCADTSWNGTAREWSEKRRRENLPDHVGCLAEDPIVDKFSDDSGYGSDGTRIVSSPPTKKCALEEPAPHQRLVNALCPSGRSIEVQGLKFPSSRSSLGRNTQSGRLDAPLKDSGLKLVTPAVRPHHHNERFTQTTHPTTHGWS